MSSKLFKKGFLLIKSFFKTDDIKRIEYLFIKFISKYCKKKNKYIYNETLKVLKLYKNSLVFRKKSLLLLEKIEKVDAKLFYEISKYFGYSEELNFIINKKKLTKILRNYFGDDYSFIQRRNPILLFNKKKLDRLKYNWHQESQFYPNHDKNLHLWFPILRDIKSTHDGGLVFALGSNNKNYPYSTIKKKLSWMQKIPKINVEQKFKQYSPTISRGDVLLFVDKIMHKSDEQKNDLPRTSLVVRFISNSDVILPLP